MFRSDPIYEACHGHDDKFAWRVKAPGIFCDVTLFIHPFDLTLTAQAAKEIGGHLQEAVARRRCRKKYLGHAMFEIPGFDPTETATLAVASWPDSESVQLRIGAVSTRLHLEAAEDIGYHLQVAGERMEHFLWTQNADAASA